MPRVLLIDDDELSRAVLELHLSAAGHDVTEAESGESALRLLQAGAVAAFDVVLSDVQMPGLSGSALAQKLRLHPGAHVPLLAMSGSQPAPERIAGFDGFLLKPFTAEQFEQALRGLADGRPQTEAEPPPHVASATGVVLDEAVFAQLATMMQPAQIAEIFALSFSELEKNFDRMQAAFDRGDTAALRADAHAMKGGFSILGALEMRDLGATLEAGTVTAADQEATLAQIPLAAERLRRMLTSRGLPLGNRSSGQETR